MTTMTQRKVKAKPVKAWAAVCYEVGGPVLSGVTYGGGDHHVHLIFRTRDEAKTLYPTYRIARVEIREVTPKPRKVPRDLSTPAKRKWWKAIDKAAKGAPRLRNKPLPPAK